MVACLVLLAVYATLTLALNDPRGTLGTDTGGKLATLHAMDERGTLDPNIGYWAAHWDPTGKLHPLFYTYPVGGKWVNVTTLPMLVAAYPLYRIGGERAILLLPMLGALLCAFAARALALRLGDRNGWTAFWVIGLASPVAIYALDFWEHTVGLGLMMWGVVLILDVAEERVGWPGALGAGAAFGVAATMRTEALVYLAVAAAVGCLALAVRRRELRRALGSGVAILAGAAAVLIANDALERQVLGTTLRASRAANTADAVGTSLGTRLQEAWTTTVGLNRFTPDLDFLVGALIVCLLAYGAWRLSRGSEGRLVGEVVLGIALLLLLVRVDGGLGFVPGLLTASPFAAVGLFLGWKRHVRVPTLIACLALPVVWAFQYSGGAGPQWGGRYELLSGALLAVVAVVVLGGQRRVLALLLGVSLLVTGFGVAWLSVRSHGVVTGIEAIVARHDQAVISVEAHVLREGGAFYEPDRHWLTATTDTQLLDATRILGETGDREFAYVTSAGGAAPRAIGDFRRGATQKVEFLRSDVFLDVVTYRRS